MVNVEQTDMRIYDPREPALPAAKVASRRVLQVGRTGVSVLACEPRHSVLQSSEHAAPSWIMKTNTDRILQHLRHRNRDKRLCKAAARLEAAIRNGRGHVMVTGQNHDATEQFLDSALEAISDIEIRHMDGRSGFIPAGRGNVILIVHDADRAGAAKLESLRMSAESTTKGIESARLVLVGSPILERMLASHELRALASRVEAHIRLGSRSRRLPREQRAAERFGKPRWTGAVLSAAAAATLVYMGSKTLPARAVAPTLQAARQAATRVGNEITDSAAQLVAAIARSNARSTLTQRRAVASTSHTAPSGRAPKSLVSGSTPSLPSPPSRAAYDADSRRPAATADTTRPAPIDEGQNIIARASTGRVAPFFTVQTRGVVNAPFPTLASVSASVSDDLLGGSDAVIETLLMARTLGAPTSRHPLVRQPVLQVGAYPETREAFALKGFLARLFDVVAVARFDPGDEPVFAVRVFDVDTQRSRNSVESVARAGLPMSVHLLAR